MAKQSRKAKTIASTIAEADAKEILNVVPTIEETPVEKTKPVIVEDKTDQSAWVKPLGTKTEILPEQFSVEAGRLALSMMTAQKKSNPAFQHLTEENLAAIDKFTTKTVNTIRNGQKLDKAAQQAAFTMNMNVKRCYTNFFNYYFFEAIAVKKGTVPEIIDSIENDDHINAILASCRGFIRFRVNRGQGFKLFNLHSYIANCFKPIVRLQKEGLLSCESVDNLWGFLESLKTLGELYNDMKANPSDTGANNAFQTFLKTFF